MSTHNKEELLINALLDAAARGWLADVFVSFDDFDDEEKEQYTKLREHIRGKINDALGEFRRGLNTVPKPDDDGPGRSMFTNPSVPDDDGIVNDDPKLEPHCVECGGCTSTNPGHQQGCSYGGNWKTCLHLGQPRPGRCTRCGIELV